MAASAVTTVARTPQAPTCAGCAALERRIAALEAAIKPPVPDDVALLSAAARLGAAFSARELANHAAVDDELRAALGGVTSPRKIGRRLHRLADQAVGKYRLTKIDRDATGVIWSVQVV